MKKIMALGVVLSCVLVLFSGCFGGGKVKATVVTNSGETKEMTLDEIKEIGETNKICKEYKTLLYPSDSGQGEAKIRAFQRWVSRSRGSV